MNCEDFNRIIHELADYTPMQASIRDAGVSHIALCADCAAKLASARTVSSNLVIAISAESEEAPARIKENLLAAFAELQQKPVTARVVDISSGRRLRWWTAAAVALAAAILLAVVLPAWIGRPGSDVRPPSSELKVGVSKTIAPPIDVKPGSTTATIKQPVRPRVSRQRRPEVPSTNDRYETVAQNTGEYLPLTYLANTTAIDSGTIVRVELSRSALASLGLALSFEGSGASVKAEVVMGDDGVARAIRLVE